MVEHFTFLDDFNNTRIITYIHMDICKAPIQEEDLSAHTKTLNKGIHNAQIIIK